MHTSRLEIVCAAMLAIGVVLLCGVAMGDANRPRVFITDSQSWEIAGSAGGANGAFASSMRGGARPQTAEIIKTFGERCEPVIVNNRQEKADYIVLLDHEGGKGYLRRRNKVAVFNKDGDAIVSRSTRSLGNSVQDACEAIVADWAGHGQSASAAAAAPAPPAQVIPDKRALLAPDKPRTEALTAPPPLAPAAKHDAEVTTKTAMTPTAQVEHTSAPSATDAGTVSITSNPDGAEIFIDSVGQGHAPTILHLPAGKHTVQLVAAGYKDWSSEIAVKSNSVVNVTADLQK